MPCGHSWKKINDVAVCVKCGLVMANGKVMFDRALPSRKMKKRKART